MDNFKTILEMKSELFKTKVRDDQRSHTFTNSAGDKRITLGVYVTDGYRDTVEEGISIVKEYIEGSLRITTKDAGVGVDGAPTVQPRRQRYLERPAASCSCAKLRWTQVRPVPRRCADHRGEHTSRT